MLLSLDHISLLIIYHFQSLLNTTGKINRDEGIGITRNEYKDGFSLFGFDLSPALCVGGHQEFKRSGNLRLSLEFGQLLQTSTTVFVLCGFYADYDNLISVYKNKQVLKD